jgi:hypothetical protein
MDPKEALIWEVLRHRSASLYSMQAYASIAAWHENNPAQNVQSLDISLDKRQVPVWHK